MIKLSIIIVSYNTASLLKDCISSILLSSFSFDYEIIVVDNHSTDNTLEMLKSFPSIKIISNTKNLLFAQANNLGASIAKGKYLLLLNSDTLIWGDNIDKLVKYFDTVDDSVICIGPKILNEDRSVQSEGNLGMTHWDMIVKHFKVGQIFPKFVIKGVLPPGTYRFNKNTPHAVAWVSGACMLIRADLYSSVGGLNEKLEFYGEEPEFGFRTSNLGYRTLYYPYSEIIHLGGKSTPQSFREKEMSLRRYTILVEQTVGYSYAIWTSRITRFSYFLKYLMTFKSSIRLLIRYETDVIKYIKLKLKNSPEKDHL
ncbi:glycosyltransferase family 2 protein [Barnesiella sp. An55]|uniref:glycosyltransferase family 2 protein n=1 Tax=Barnesiella sp. An55 TaxID=1965646 RepID=UPI001302D51A|nr:glycosyltransferase family 2 protein [Barnesiella sp. An55]